MFFAGLLIPLGSLALLAPAQAQQPPPAASPSPAPAATPLAPLKPIIQNAQEFVGTFQILPVSAPGLALEVTGTESGAAVVLNTAAPAAKSQQWEVVSKGGEGYFVIRPVGSPTLALALSNGSNRLERLGDPIIVELEKGKEWHYWSLRKNPNGTLSLCPRFYPNKALENHGGNKQPGGKAVLWLYREEDPNVQWKFQPVTAQP